MKAGRKAGLAALVAAALTVSGASPGTSRAATLPGDFFGMVPLLERPTPADLQLMAQNGVESARLSIGWGFIEPQPGVRNWADYDSLIADMAKAGIRPSPQLFGVPGWVNAHPAHPPIYTASERSAWSSVVTDLAARYGNGGDFWQMHPELPYMPLTTWEVWNEPNLRGFWDGKPNPGRFVQLLQLTGNALRQGDPAAQVVLGGIFPDPPRKYGSSGMTFLNRLYRVPGSRDAFDAMGLHPYATQPRRVLDTCLKVRRLMAKHHDRSTPLWVTELGWTTGGVEFKVSPLRASERNQAKLLTKSFGLLIRSRGRLRLERIFWHSWRDYGGPGPKLWTLEMGLLRSDGTPKPSLAAYARVAGRQ